ncbi:helicase C-terminal domain-containing protein [Acanthopleuribacter pedis]|uniref:PD-(D/E)XK nuclease family protein n=1 Tax=Acanthopleuribacter pedis TaxID=442870 RepID=A0A8J7QAU3_9BACT|nr:helicase C-terminal domain-containing protein [Acanthopleuribacter pedis]MBO1320775.1 PD-(D/E)XK nuclease family protein [Acanthopleuribacter pedis]
MTAQHPTAAETAPPVLRFSVRDMAAFALRSGDLYQHWFRSPTGQQGIRGHQRLQRRRGAGYQAEVPVRLQQARDGFVLDIRGRIDGVQRDVSPVVVEEIKTTLLDFARLPENAAAVHMGQAMLYAWMLAEAEDLDRVTVRLSYLHIEKDETHERHETHTRAELQVFFQKVLDQCYAWQRRLLAWRQTRDASLATLPFPRTFRAGQRRLAEESYRVIRDRGRLLAEAPTGIGKSLGVLFPAVKALGAHGLDTLFYLTAKGTGRHAALGAARQLAEVGMRLKVLVLTARDKTCFVESGACDTRGCPFALGYYDRFRAAMADLFARDFLDQATLHEVARAHSVCPFELSLDMTPYVDLIIADVNYAFDPGAFLRRFFGEDKQETVLLIDEAHNLVERGRAMFSAAFEKRDVLEARRALKSTAPEVAKALARLNRHLKKRWNELEEAGREVAVTREKDDAFADALDRLGSALALWQTEREAALFKEPLPEVLRELGRFRRLCEFFGDDFVWVTQRFGKNLRVQLLCLNPGPMIRQRLAQVRAAVFFSATLTPFDYHQRLFGLDEKAKRLRLPSPFDSRRQYTLIAQHISTRYRDRGRSLPALIQLIQTVIAAKQGNYLVFLPSYQYMQQVVTAFSERDHGVEVLVQERAMDEDARLAFLAAFERPRAHGLLAFAVMGGVFGEGVDLVGERLIGVIVVGVGLPKICLERDLIRDHFGLDQGFNVAYRVPGFHKVLQTAGRVIRDSADRGVVCLVDNRFTDPDYLALFPPFWRAFRADNTRQLEQGLADFWSEEVR